MKVIGTSLCRTGTYTLKLALDQLGAGPCYHMYELHKRPEDLSFFEKAFRTGTCDWDQLYQDFSAAVDYPNGFFWETQFRAYPDAKFIHVERDPEAWYKSINSTVFPSIFEAIASEDAFAVKRNLLLKEMLLDTFFEGRHDDKAFAIRKYLEHREQVKATIPESQLLFFNLKEGWNPLCEFLELPIPNQALPNINNTSMFWDIPANTGRLQTENKLKKENHVESTEHRTNTKKDFSRIAA